MSTEHSTRPEARAEHIPLANSIAKNRETLATLVDKAKGADDAPEYPLNEGVAKLIGMIRERMTSSLMPVVVEIAGGSASGKTDAVASKIRQAFGEQALILSIDDYYRGKTYMASESAKGNTLNWDQPEALNLDLLHQQLAQLKRGETIEKPIYCMSKSEPTHTVSVAPKRVIILEGLFALDHHLEGEGDVKAFVEIGTHGRVIRRLLRDIQRTGLKPADILRYFSEVVQPMHDKYVQTTKKNANLVIRNEFSPEIEASRSGLHEIQMKFEGNPNLHTLHNLGARKMSTSHQTDHYYNPGDRDLIETGEILRIRHEGGDRTLTYKGPIVIESEFTKRAKFEFGIDVGTEIAFLGIYGDKTKTIEKERSLYLLDGVEFSVDKVSKSEGDLSTPLGTFIEIRSTDSESKQAIRKVAAKLGLDPEKGIVKSYFEM
jgi:uridine kinase